MPKIFQINIFNKNIDQFLYAKKSDLYLMKIQIFFICRKNFKSISNENVDLFCMQKNLKSVSNENTDPFITCRKISNLYLTKI